MAECTKKTDRFSDLLESDSFEYDTVAMQNNPIQGEGGEENFLSTADVTERRCHLCDVDFTSKTHRDSHLKGKKHKSLVLRKQMTHIPLRCDVCVVSFSSEISAKDHFISSKHKKKVLFGSTDDVRLSILPTDILSPGIDRTRWVSCEVCKVQVNSHQQLYIHRQSPKHLKKVEETNNSDFSPSLPLVGGTLLPNEDNREKSYTDPIVQRNLLSLPNVTLGRTPIEDSKIYTTNKNCNNLENSFRNIKSSVNDCSVSCTTTTTNNNNNNNDNDNNVRECLLTSDSPIAYKEETDKKTTNGNSSDCSVMVAAGCSDSSVCSPVRSSALPNEKVLKMIGCSTTDPNFPMKKVPNSDQVNNNNNNNTDASKTNKVFEKITNNNLNLPAETSPSESDNHSANSSQSILTTEDVNDTISSEDVANIIGQLNALSIQPDILISEEKLGKDKISNNKNSSNYEMPRRSSLSSPSAITSGSNRRKSKPTISSSGAGTDEDESQDWHRMGIEKIEKFGKVIGYFCNLCETPLNQGNIKHHVEGITHRHTIMTKSIPDRELPPVTRVCEDATDEAFELTKFMPRGYQVELFEKCYSTDSIIFLPTGTGKTLCAAMLISFMLKKNPQRPVLFLVDKVLLTLQQKDFIEKQLNKEFERFNFQDNKLVTKKLDIACVCGSIVVDQAKPLWMYDIVISTAAFCSNMIDKNVLRWSDFSFVVVDEVHHCSKNHPFKKIFSRHHMTLEEDKRPKVLGLTASPAGQETIEDTIIMLHRLSKNLGNARIAIVEDAVSELNKYKSNARLEIEMLSPSNEEMSFNFHLQKYLMHCLVRLAESSNISKYIDFITLDENFVLSSDKLDELQNVLCIIDITKDKITNTSLLLHVTRIATVLAVSFEMGIPLALEELKPLINNSRDQSSFSKAMELGLPCDRVKEMSMKYMNTMDNALWEKEEIMSTVIFLIHKITTLLENEKNVKMTTVLVLVKQRATAIGLGQILKKSSAMQQHNLSTISLVGHGAGSSTGMNVSDQKRILKEIKDNLHQVIVATSVAEEGIDLPECSLVITMKPPTSITTLVQMRGRARKKDSLFLTICSNENEKAKIEKILKQEIIMEKATRSLVNYYKEH